MHRLILLCLILLGGLFTESIAQKVQNEKVEFPYLRLPFNPLPTEIENYSVEVDMPYAQEYLLAMEQWEIDKARAQKEYDDAMEAYNNKKTGKKIAEKMFLGDGKPQLRLPYQPVMTQKIFDASLMSSYISLDGYNKGEGNEIKFLVTMYGYERTPTELKSRTTTNSKTKVKTTYYQKVLMYKHAMRLTATLPNGEIVYDELVGFTDQFVPKASKEVTSTSALNKSWNERTIDLQLQDMVARANLSKIKDMINDLYGFTTVQRNTVIKKVKPKKHQYPEYDEAFMAATAGYRMIDTDYETAMPKIQEAINQWEAALEESDPENKKARINAKVTMATYLNLAEAYTWISDFTKAEECISKFYALKPGTSMKGAGNHMKEFLEDQRTRVTRNAE